MEKYFDIRYEFDCPPCTEPSSNNQPAASPATSVLTVPLCKEGRAEQSVAEKQETAFGAHPTLPAIFNKERKVKKQ